MADRPIYRIALEYAVAERFAERLPADYAAGTDIASLANDRFLITEPDIVLFPAVALPPETDVSSLNSRLAPVDLSGTIAEIGVTRIQIEQFGEEPRLLVTVRPEFDLGALQAEVSEYIRAINGEILMETIPHVTRRDIPEAYVMVYDLSAPAVARPHLGLFGRLRSRLAEWLRSEGTVFAPFGSVRAHASVRAETPQLSLTAIDAPPSAAIKP